jgi:hypothetical protein
MKDKLSWHYLLNIIYFSIVGIEIVVELFESSFLSLLLRILLPIILALLYFKSSLKQNRLFYVMLCLLLISNFIFYFRNNSFFVYGIIAFILLRIVSLIIILNETKEKSYLQIIVTSFPFLVIFFYLISVTNEITESEFNILILQSILISILAGISITNYFKNENRQHSWLLISTLLFIGLRFIVFIERFIISDLTLLINRPIEVILNAFAFYTFYKYIIASEVSNSKTNS